MAEEARSKGPAVSYQRNHYLKELKEITKTKLITWIVVSFFWRYISYNLSKFELNIFL